MLNNSEPCDCVVPCHTERYIPNLSSTYLSQLNIARLVLQDPGEKDAVKIDFENSMETLQRAKNEIVTSDRTIMNKILRQKINLESTLFGAYNNFPNFSTFSEANNLIDIVDAGYLDVKDDMLMFNNLVNDQTTEIYAHRTSFISEMQHRWRFLNVLSNVSGDIFPFFKRFEECLSDGLSDGSTNTNLLMTTDSPPLEDITSTPDVNDTSDDPVAAPAPPRMSVDANGIPIDITYLGPLFQANQNSPVFESSDCDNDIWFIPSLSYMMIEMAKDKVGDFFSKFIESYTVLQHVFPDEVLRNQPAHNQCLNLLDWISTTGKHAFEQYADLHSILAVVTDDIRNNYIFQIERNIDRSELSNLVDLAFNIATDINTLIFSDDMSYFRSIENFPYVEIKESDVDNFEYKDDRVVVLPDTFDDGDIRSCLWLSNQLVQYEAFELMDLYLLQYENEHEDLKDQFNSLIAQLATLQTYYTKRVQPDLEMITRYNDNEIEKLALQSAIGSVHSGKRTDDFTDKLNNLDTIVEETVEELQDDFDITLALYHVPLELSLPLYSYEIMNATKIGRQLMKHMTAPHTGYNNTVMQENFSKTFTDTLEKHRDRIIDILQEMQSTLIDTNDRIVDDLAELREELYDFKVATTMDSSFYM